LTTVTRKCVPSRPVYRDQKKKGVEEKREVVPSICDKKPPSLENTSVRGIRRKEGIGRGTVFPPFFGICAIGFRNMEAVDKDALNKGKPRPPPLGTSHGGW